MIAISLNLCLVASTNAFGKGSKQADRNRESFCEYKYLGKSAMM